MWYLDPLMCVSMCDSDCDHKNILYSFNKHISIILFIPPFYTYYIHTCTVYSYVWRYRPVYELISIITSFTFLN